MRLIAPYIAGVLVGLGITAMYQAVRPKSESGSARATAQVYKLTADETTAKSDEQYRLNFSRRNAITRAVESCAPAVVGINVIQVREYIYRSPFFDDPFFRSFFPDQIYRHKVENLGSGFIISSDGYILTNQHVVHGASQIIVTRSGGEKYDAEVVGFDFDSDIALLKINADDLPYIPFGNSDSVIIGEWSIAIGNPFGLFSINAEPTVTVGVVSATDRDFDRNADGRLYLDMIQTDAAINRGNSGGPLVNAQGELIGMNTMIFTESGGSIGLGFAIPSNRLVEVYEQLRKRGNIDRNFWVGIQIQTVNRLIALSLRLPEIRGVVITDVESGSPAEKAGLEPTDVIVAVNGVKINDAQGLQSLFRNSDLRVGDTLKLTVIREGKPSEIPLKLEKKSE